IAPPELEEDVASDGNSDKWHAAGVSMIEDAGNILGVFFHKRRTIDHAGFTMAAQIRKEQPVARDQRVRDRAPEPMIGRQWTKQPLARGHCAYALSTIRAQIRVILNHLAAIIAIHNALLQSMHVA